jgi:stress-induced morphogen
MAEGTLAEPTYVAQVSASLQAALPNAQLTHEQVRRDRYRFIMVDETFENMGHPERQRLVWNIAEKALSDRADLLKVAMIITLAPSELYSE